MRKHITTIVLIIILVALAATAVAADSTGQARPETRPTLVLQAQQQAILSCVGDELIVTKNGKEAEVICRVWLR